MRGKTMKIAMQVFQEEANVYVRMGSSSNNKS